MRMARTRALPVFATLARSRLLPLTGVGARREVGLAWASDRPLVPSTAAFRRFVLAGGGDGLHG